MQIILCYENKKTFKCLSQATTLIGELYSVVVHSCDKRFLHPLQTLQKKIIRIICTVKQKDDITNNSLYKELEILKIKDIYQLEMAEFMFLYKSKASHCIQFLLHFCQYSTYI